MKKIFLFLSFLSACIYNYGQLKMQGTIKPGSLPGSVDVYVRPSASFSQKDEAMTFALALPAAIVPAPSLGTSGTTANSTGLVSGITGLQPKFIVNNLGSTLREVVVTNEEINSASYFIYTFIFAGTATATHDWTAGVEQQLFTIGFEGCTSNCSIRALKMVSLPNGGSTNNTYWYFQPNTVGDITNYANPFYANSSSGAVVNGGSADGSALSMIDLAGTIILPVQLQSFTASIKECTVNLSWQTSNEVNIAYYALERSEQGRAFAEISRITAAGNSSMLQSYKTSDKVGRSGKFLYRLRLVDKDNKWSYSNVISAGLNCSGKEGIVVFPTLSNGQVTAIMSPGFEKAVIKIINSVGKEVITDISEDAARNINLSALSNGLYMVQVTLANKVIYQVKIVLHH